MRFAIVRHDGRSGLVADIQDASEPGAILLPRDQGRPLVARSQAA
jgi:hypothetical protein